MTATTAAQQCAELTFKAQTLFRQGDPEGAFGLALEALRTGKVPLEQGAYLERLLRDLEHGDLADQIRDQVMKGISLIDTHFDDEPEALLHVSGILVLMEEHAAALPYLDGVLSLSPDHYDAIFLKMRCALETETFEPDRLDITGMLETLENPAVAVSKLVTLLGQYKENAEALRLLDQAEPLIGPFAPGSPLAMKRAALMGQTIEIDQREMATNIFDTFAEVYDANLASLANNGPDMIGHMLDDLNVAKDSTLKVFDAGCGTGLCAPILRPRASLLHGADLSVQMLEKCLAKSTFDLLCRSDLAAIETLPDDTFDLVVCADVLVYFSALTQVFENLATRLVPGGLFVFTVEAAPDDLPAPGFGLTVSGRNHHSLPYLKKTLDQTGFEFLSMRQETLRLEFRKPILGYAVAARKRS